MSSSWIVSEKFDFRFIILPIFLSPLIFIFFIQLSKYTGSDPYEISSWIYLIFLLLFDQAHVFQSFTYAFSQKRGNKKHRIHLLVSFILIVLTAPFLYYASVYESIFLVFPFIGMLHVFKQNFYFLKKYQKLSKEDDENKKRDQFIYIIFFTFVFLMGFLPLTFFVLLDKIPSLKFLLNFVTFIDQKSLSILFIIILFYFGKEAYRWWKGEVINKSKSLYMGFSLVNYFFIAIVSFELEIVPVLLLITLDTIYHSIQYQGRIFCFLSKEKKKLKSWRIRSYLYALITVSIFAFITYADEYELVKLFLVMIMVYHFYLDLFIDQDKLEVASTISD